MRQLLLETPIDWSAIASQVELLPSDYRLFSKGQSDISKRNDELIPFEDLLGQHAPLDAVKAIIHANTDILDSMLLWDVWTHEQQRVSSDVLRLLPQEMQS